MPTSANIGALLQSYALRQQSAFVNYFEFCDYVKKYAERHVEDQAELVKFLGNAEPAVRAELETLRSNYQAYLIEQAVNKKTIIATAYFSVQFAQVYKNITTNPTIPFPKLSDLPKQVPTNSIPKESAELLFPKLYEAQETKSPNIYCVLLPHEAPAILFPLCVPIGVVTEIALTKIRTVLKKEEYYDYFLKKVRSTNHGKEISVQNFYRDFVANQRTAASYVENGPEQFYYLNQLCYHIRQDLMQVKDMTPESENLIQSVGIVEIQLHCLKNKLQDQQIKEDALKELDMALKKMPYFFSSDTIYKFTDSHGALLLGQYTEDDLKAYINRMTSGGTDQELPPLLVFKTETGTRYFIHKTKVIPLVIRLCYEAHDTIEKELTEEWSRVLMNFERLPEMRDHKKFNDVLKEKVRKRSPILHAILNSTFLSVLNYETMPNVSVESIQLFVDGKLLPYSTILMLKESTVLANAKIVLPFWYSIPVVSTIIALFYNRNKNKAAAQNPQQDKSEKREPSVKLSREDEIAAAARRLEEQLVPEGSTIDRELDSFEKQWNKLITKTVHAQLTEDVNAVVRDYLRKVSRTLSGVSITQERLESLADTLVKAPNMQKIGEPQALKMYIKLYMLRLLSNL